jgi:oxaloacetate decarboxylase alpha subunit
VIDDERYTTIPDQVIRYALGSFGRPTAPIDAEVADRILSTPRARELAAEPPPPGPAELRKRFRPGIPDEELLLRATMPGEQVDAMLAAGPARTTRYDPELEPILDLLRGLASRPPVSHLVVEQPDLRLELRGPA